MKVIFREASFDDASIIREIAQATWFDTYNEIIGAEQAKYMFDEIYTIKSLQSQMESGQKFVLLIADEAAIAFASYSYQREKVYKLNKIYLNPLFQSGGYGRLMLAEVESRLKKEGAEYLELNVNRFNKALNFYLKMGFSILKEVDIPFGIYWMNDYVLGKAL